MIDYGALPPEINSGRMYAGAGSGPMLAAATAWDVLAEELSRTAAALGTTVMDLSGGPWRGPASMSMAAAGLPFAAWFSATATQAEQAAIQAKAAAAAYETAFAMTVPPPVVAANRAQLIMLVATNFFGQNTPAIAATEAHYAAMWAQDAAAMYGYAGGSTAASKFSEFSAPPQTTNPVAPSAQAGTVAHNAGTTAAPSTMPAPLPAHPTAPAAVAPQALAEMAASGTSPAVPGTPGSVAPVAPGLKAFLDQWTSLNRLAGSGFSPTPLGDAASQGMITWEHAPNAYTGVRDFLADGANAAKSAGTSAVATPGAGGGLPTAALSRGIQIGGLSVPQAWPVEPNPAAAALTTSRVASAAAAEGLPRRGFGMPGMPGMTAAGGAAGFRFVPRYGYRHKVMNRPPGAG